MTTLWVVIIATAIATVLIKAAGPVLYGGRRLPARTTAVASLLAPTLLAALIVTQVLGREGALVLDERLAGVAVAAVAIALRAHVLLVVLLAAVTVALIRYIT